MGHPLWMEEARECPSVSRAIQLSSRGSGVGGFIQRVRCAGGGGDYSRRSVGVGALVLELIGHVWCGGDNGLWLKFCNIFGGRRRGSPLRMGFNRRRLEDVRYRSWLGGC